MLNHKANSSGAAATQYSIQTKLLLCQKLLSRSISIRRLLCRSCIGNQDAG